MKKVLFIVTTILLVTVLKADAQDYYSRGDAGNISQYHGLFTVVKEEYLDVCGTGTKSFFKVSFQNTSNTTLTIEIAIKTTSGRWEAGVDAYVKPGAIGTFGTCRALAPGAQYKWWAQPSDKANKLPSPEEIRRLE